MKQQNKWTKSKVVRQSLNAFDSLRKRLAYLRSVSIVMEQDDESTNPPVPVWIADMLAFRISPAARDAEQLRSQVQSYYLATTSMPIALLYSALCDYKELAEMNADLSYGPLDRVLAEMEARGLLGKMRDLRNAMFHVRPNKRIDQLVHEIMSLSSEKSLKFAHIERLLYDFTEYTFRHFSLLLQEDRRKLEDGFKQALAHYDTLPQSVRDEHQEELQKRGKALDAYLVHPDVDSTQ